MPAENGQKRRRQWTLLSDVPDRQSQLLAQIQVGRFYLFLAIIVISSVLKLAGVVELSWSALLPLSIFALGLVTLFYLAYRNRWDQSSPIDLVWFWLISDVVLVDLIIHFSGGPQSQFYIFYLASWMSGAFLWGKRGVWIYLVFNFAGYITLLGIYEAQGYEVPWGENLVIMITAYAATFIGTMVMAQQQERAAGFRQLKRRGIAQLDMLNNLLARIEAASESLRQTSLEVNRISSALFGGIDTENHSLEENEKALSVLTDTIGDIDERMREFIANIRQSAGQMSEIITALGQMSSRSVEMVEIAAQTPVHVQAEREAIARIVKVSHRALREAETVQEAVDSTINANEEVSRRIDESVQAVSETLAETAKGRQTAWDQAELVNRIRTAIDSTADVVEALTEQTDEIGEIIHTINGITGKTSLLALNASIVAAQAGVHGKSFSVVAGEIRALAVASAESTKSITEILESIREKTVKAREDVRIGREQAQEGAVLSEQNAQIINRVEERVQTLHQSIEVIQNSNTDVLERARQIQSASGVIQGTHRDLSEITAEQQKQVDAMLEEAKRVSLAAEAVNVTTAKQSGTAETLRTIMDGLQTQVETVSESVRRQQQAHRQLEDTEAALKDVAKTNVEIAEHLVQLAESFDRQSHELSETVRERRNGEEDVTR